MAWSHKKTHEYREFKCQKCDKVYKCQSGLTAHVKQVHSEEKNYECITCGQKYKQNRMLLQHMKLIHQPKEFQCNICNKFYALRHVLTEHVKRRHDKIEQIKNVKCLDCDKMFPNLSMMQAHAIMHTEPNIECSNCGKKFRTSDTLKMHMITHTTDKPYVCDKCEKAYNNHGSLSHHRKVCKGAPEVEKSCNLCDFTSKSIDQSALNKVLKYHINEKHSDVLNQT